MTGNGIDTTVSHSARIWDYWLGGTDNYAVDRELGDRIEEMLPDIVRQAREDRQRSPGAGARAGPADQFGAVGRKPSMSYHGRHDRPV
jgi:hypothetical protein